MNLFHNCYAYLSAELRDEFNTEDENEIQNSL